ncbi:MAG: hypothetical protein HYS12_10435 [Planctomycetes bacterium]|nr:hypothetical protein [Planctomycetota bacterium]
MGLTQVQRTILSKARAVGGGKQGVALSDGACAFLVGVIARDLNLLKQFPELPKRVPKFFSSGSLEGLVIPSVDFVAMFERLVGLDANADTYFSCLATLHKTRLKYARILQTQPVPTIDQVGPRGLLQFGTIVPKALRKGRQCDCVLEKRAYEIKIRVTIAASGQGRWREELDFPTDCKFSGYVPVLVVLDPTPNPKLDELKRKFLAEGGEVHIGRDAWKHFDSLAGTTLSRFLQLYVHTPIQALLAQVHEKTEDLPDLHLTMAEGAFTASILGETLKIKRQPKEEEESGPADLAAVVRGEGLLVRTVLRELSDGDHHLAVIAERPQPVVEEPMRILAQIVPPLMLHCGMQRVKRNAAKSFAAGSAWAASCGGAKTATSSSRRKATESPPCGQTGRVPEQAPPPETPWQVGTLLDSPAATPCGSRRLRRRGSLPRGGVSWQAAWQADLPETRRRTGDQATGLRPRLSRPRCTVLEPLVELPPFLPWSASSLLCILSGARGKDCDGCLLPSC